MPMANTLKERLKAARKEAGCTQAQVAEAAGISQPTYSDLETGTSEGTSHLPAIAFYLGVRPYWLATGNGPKHESEFLDAQERELITAWRSLSREQKALVLTQFRALSDAHLAEQN